MKVGFRHCDSRKCPTNLSMRRRAVLGEAQSTLCFLACSLKKFSAYFDSSSVGSFSPRHFSSSSIIEILRHGGVKSISITFSGSF